MCLASQFLLERLFIYILKQVHLSKFGNKYFYPWGNGYKNFVGPPKGPKFKVLAIICCGYSKLVSRDAWHNAKEIGSIWSPCCEKTSKTFKILGIFWNNKIGPCFGSFLRAYWSDWVDSFCIVPGVPIHKFRVPTTYSCENFEFWPLRRADKIFVAISSWVKIFFSKFR